MVFSLDFLLDGFAVLEVVLLHQVLVEAIDGSEGQVCLVILLVFFLDGGPTLLVKDLSVCVIHQVDMLMLIVYLLGLVGHLNRQQELFLVDHPLL